MNPRKRVILEQRGGEIAKAGRMFFDALFSKDTEAFLSEKGEELERELAEKGAITVEGEIIDDHDHARRSKPGRGGRGR